MRTKIMLAAMLLVGGFACKKESGTNNQNVPTPQFSTTPYHHFGGYFFYLAGFDFYTEIVVDDPDPDVKQQELNEKMLYIGMALDAAQCDLHDVNANVLAAVNGAGTAMGVTAKDFFNNYSQYMPYLQNVLTQYGIPLTTFFDPITMYGYDMVPGIRVPENAINDSEPDAAIAMGIEVRPPFHDEREDYEEDYIPAYFPVSGEGEACSVETVVGFDEIYSDYNTFPLEEQLAGVSHTIILITQIEVDGQGIIMNKADFKPKVISSNITTGGPGCEEAQNLEIEYGIFRNRWQKYGKSIIRAKYIFDDPYFINTTYKFWKFAKLDKNYFNNPTQVTPTALELKTLYGLDPVFISQMFNQPVKDKSGPITIYEYDWFGWPRTIYWKGQTSGTEAYLILIQQKSPWEKYCEAEFDPFNWCHGSYSINGYYNNNSEVKFYAN